MNILDAFMVTIGLDRSDFKRGSKEVQDEQRRMKQGAEDQAKAQVRASKQATDAFNSLKKEALSLATVILGGMGIAQFVTATVALDANVGRLSKTLGMSTEAISSWQGAIREMGGTSQDAVNDLRTITNAFEQIQLGQGSPLIPYFQRLGISLSDLSNPTQALLKIADQFHGMDPRLAYTLGHGMGLSDPMINLLIKGRQATLAYLEAAEKAYAIHQRDAEAGEKLQKQLALLGSAWQRAAATLLTAFTPALLKLANLLERVGEWLTKHPHVAMLVFAAAVAFLALAAANAGLGLIGLGANGVTAIASLAAAAPELLPLLATLTAIAALLIVGPKVVKKLADAAADAGYKAGGGKGSAPHVEPAPMSLGGKTASGRTVGPGIIAPGVGLAIDFAKGFLAAGDGAGGGAPAAAGAPSPRGLAATIVAFFKAHGASDASAEGIAAGVTAEGGTPTAQNPNSSAYAIGQWLKARQGDFRKVIGHDIHGSTLQEQLQFMLYEMTQGKEQKAGLAIRNARSAADAMIAYVTQYMRPGSGTGGDLARGAKALGIHIDNLQIITQTDDPKVMAREFHAALVAQANRGLD